MSIVQTNPIPGSAQNGFTSPTYTTTADVAPSNNGKQFAVTTLGGTQTNVETHSVSKPFTITVTRPATLAVAPTPNPVTGIVRNVPKNKYVILTRKGVTPGVNQSNQLATIRTEITVPAGADTFEPEDIKALLSAHFGFLNQQSSGLGDLVLTGIL